jgi:hypothetical protein
MQLFAGSLTSAKTTERTLKPQSRIRCAAFRAVVPEANLISASALTAWTIIPDDHHKKHSPYYSPFEDKNVNIGS